MKVLVLGHSFVSRLEAYIKQRNISMPPNRITCMGQGGCYLEGSKYSCLLNDAHIYLATTGCQVLYLALGSNDLDSKSSSPADVARKLWYMARRLKAMYNIRWVFIEQILNRCPDKYPGFEDLAKEANSMVQKYITQGNDPQIMYWKHRKMDKPRKNILDHKGVHLNETGMRKYWRSVRGAIAYAEAKLH